MIKNSVHIDKLLEIIEMAKVPSTQFDYNVFNFLDSAMASSSSESVAPDWQ